MQLTTKELTKKDELKLVKQASRGDRDAFQRIVHHSKKKIFYLAYDLTGSQEDAEDLSQEVFIKAFRALGTFKGDASLNTWLYRITLNAYLDKKRKKSTEMEQNQQPLDEGLCAAPAFSTNPGDHQLNPNVSGPLSNPVSNPESYAESRQIQMHIQQALEQLSPRERSVFVMRHYQGMTGKEVGSMLGISDGTVKSLLSRAIKKLQTLLDIYNNSPAHKSFRICSKIFGP